MREIGIALVAVGLCIAGNVYAQEENVDISNEKIQCVLDTNNVWDDCFPKQDISVNSRALIHPEPTSLFSFKGLHTSPWAPSAYDLMLDQKERSYEWSEDFRAVRVEN